MCSRGPPEGARRADSNRPGTTRRAPGGSPSPRSWSRATNPSPRDSPSLDNLRKARPILALAKPVAGPSTVDQNSRHHSVQDYPTLNVGLTPFSPSLRSTWRSVAFPSASMSPSAPARPIKPRRWTRRNGGRACCNTCPRDHARSPPAPPSLRLHQPSRSMEADGRIQTSVAATNVSSHDPAEVANDARSALDKLKPSRWIPFKPRP